MKRSKFSLSHYRLMSCNMGGLYPIALTEVIPGDTVQQATSCLIRCSPLLAPVMHPVRVRIHHWYVPFRLIWSSFEDFITGGPTGTSLPAFPTFAGFTNTVGTLANHLGLPIGTVPAVSCLPFRAYALIWNEHYRDQDLQAEVVVSTGDGNDTTTHRQLLNCSWEKDYFTSSRPWEQKGPAVTIPIGTDAPVFSNANNGQNLSVNQNRGGTLKAWDAGGAQVTMSTVTGAVGTGLTADLQNASAVTVSRLRQALALQRFEEARARYGSRYTEYLRYLGIKSSDARLQRPEYLGGGKQIIQFSEVLQTAEGTDPVGEMAGHGIGAMRSNRYRRFFEEHGYILSLLSIQPKTIYMQGIKRTWNRRVKEDFWQRELQHIGQQAVLNKEVYAAHASPDLTFGYQDRYDEYRRTESSVAGEFATPVLNHWHMARDFASTPALNNTFVECVPTERIFADNAEDTIYVMANHSIQARRMVSGSAHSHIF